MSITFTVSSKGTLLIKEGQEVNFKTPLLKGTTATTISVNVAAHLGIAPTQIFLAIKKVVGDSVEKGEVVAQRKTMFSHKTFKSPYEGTLKEINHEDGTIVIEVSEENENTEYCFFAGEVEKVEGQKVTLKVKKAKEYDLASANDTFGAEVLFLEPEALLTLKETTVAQKVVFTEALKASDQIKIEALGAIGFVVASQADPTDEVRYAVIKKGTPLSQMQKAGGTYCIVDRKTSILYLYD